MIFVDTSFWVALRNRKDAHHEEARSLLTKHVGSQLVTSHHVRGETWTFLRRRSASIVTLRDLDTPQGSTKRPHEGRAGFLGGVRIVGESSMASHSSDWARKYTKT